MHRPQQTQNNKKTGFVIMKVFTVFGGERMQQYLPTACCKRSNMVYILVINNVM